MKLSPDEIRERKKHEFIARALRTQVSFGKIKTFEDLLRAAGYKQDFISRYFKHELEQRVTIPILNEWLSDQWITLTTAQWLRHNPPIIKPEEPTKTEAKKIHETEVVTDENTDNLKSANRTALAIEDKQDDPEFGYKASPNLPKDTYLFWHQKKAIASIIKHLVTDRERARMLIAAPGLGKTFDIGGLLRHLNDINFAQQVGCVSPFPYLVVSKASIVTKTKRDLDKYFGLNKTNQVLVINIDQLRSKFGELFVDEKMQVVEGEEVIKWTWRPMIYPCVIIWDECQSLKNPWSIQHKIAASYNELPNTWQLFVSATPGTKVSEFKCFAVATRIQQKVTSFQQCELSNENWAMFAKNIASDFGKSDTSPDEHSPAAIDRLREILNPYIEVVKNVHPQFHARNKIQMLSFETAEGRKYYNDSVERYKRKVARAEKRGVDTKTLNIIKLVAFLQYRIGAETNPDRIRFLARETNHLVKEGKAVIIAVNFKETIIKVVESLIKDYKHTRNDMSIIWGGGSKKPTEKQKAKAAIESSDEIQEMFKKFGISMEGLELDEVEAQSEKKVYPTEWRLGTQSREDRQREIDRFQTGRTVICLFTAKAGGVGLSLHHSDEYTKQKCRRKPSGYAYEEDIPLIPVRQRETLAAPSWSAIELVQLLGRGPRLTSLSDTIQRLNFFRGTEEERVAHIVSMKLRCLSKFLRQKESWEGVIIGGYTYEEVENKRLTDSSEVEVMPDNEDEELTGEVIDEDEE